MTPNSPGLRRHISGAVLAYVSVWVLGCGNNDVAAPEPPSDGGITPAAGCSNGVLEHGALFRICFPGTWNGSLVVYAHGYVAPGQPLALPNDQIAGQSVSGIVTGLGYGFATTSYRSNGLVAADAVDDLVELSDTVDRRYQPDPAKTVVVGLSEGGLVAALAVERHADRFDGALAGCGPIGSFRAQLDYIADFRSVFDYFFPGVIPGSVVDVPASVRSQWDQIYVPAIALALASHPAAARELIAVTKTPVASTDVGSIAETAAGVLWYNVFGGDDTQQRLGGQPFDNASRVYSGSSDDAALNAGIARFRADPAALVGLQRFETTGAVTVPVATLHTTGDPIVPFSQAPLYGDKVTQAGRSALLSQTTVDRFGHCSFTAPEVLGAFSALWDKVTNQSVASLAASSRR